MDGVNIEEVEAWPGDILVTVEGYLSVILLPDYSKHL